MKRLSLPYYYARSGAKFEPTESFLKNSIVVDTNTDKLESVGIPIAQIDHDTYATTRDEMHCFVIGETGCGKTRRVILPSIRLISKTGESMVISDPKGELYRYTADSLRKKGYNVRVLNFRKPRCGNRWNPLSFIETLYRSEDSENKDKAFMMLDDLISILSSGINSKDDPYWASAAASFFRGVALIILKYGKTGDLTFESVALTAKKIAGIYADKRAPLSKNDQTIKRFIDSLPKDSTIYQNLSSVIVNAESTRNCIISMFESMISMYCSQELLLDLFSKSEIDISSIGKEPTALFFILPDDSDSMYPIATYFVKQVYSTLINLADEQPNGQLPNKVTFLLDEFANFAKLPTIHAMLTAARSRKIRFVLVCQSMDQLKEKYEDAGMEILLSNCRVWLYMSCRNLPFLRRLEELIGNYTSPYTNETCPLVDIGTLQHFSMGQVLVFNDRCRPLIGYLDDYSTYDFGAEGFGEESEIPEPHPIDKRSLFILENALIKGESDEEDVPAFANNASSKGSSDDSKPPIFDNDWLKDIDTQIEKLERQLEAQNYIEKIKSGVDVVVSKNNLAYLIRHYKIDTAALEADFDLSITSLLLQGVNQAEPFSLMNLALYYIDMEEYALALALLVQIKADGFKSLKSFWYGRLWVKDKDPEGAFVSYICYAKKAFDSLEKSEIRGDGILSAWFSKIRPNVRYDRFIRDESVAEWLRSSDNPDSMNDSE